MSDTTFIAEAPLKSSLECVAGSYVELNGERYYRVANYDSMAPFFMSLVSDSDHWLFLSSNGGLTAGRKDPDHALFPYYTDDRIHDSQDQTGSKTIIRAKRNGKTYLWEPFSQRYQGAYKVSRNLLKSVYGNKIVFEEINHDLGLAFSYSWMSSERFGFVRRAVISNQAADAVKVELIDGIQNVLPYGVGRRFQLEYSTLTDGYKRTELDAATGLALFRLSSIPVDKAEPSEALRVNVAWSVGVDSATRLLSATQLESFRQGCAVIQETDLRGRRGAYLLNQNLSLAGGDQKSWYIVAELNQDAADVRALLKMLGSERDLLAEIEADVARGTENLVRIVASADGLQTTEDELSAWRHFSNTLFNVMRGGIPDDGYRIARSDFQSFLAKANTEVAGKHAAFVESLPDSLLHSELVARAAVERDVDLERLANEYLPLTFSRRHGDPSRPWNIFAIEIKDAHGDKILNYQGNWRDIFQNWEALAMSFPAYAESMIFKFLDSSTADGYNPYRVTRDGFEWEVIDPHDLWSFIGYWGDHQVIYLLKLLEQSQRFHPGVLGKLLARDVFTYANVPYRIKPYADLLSNSRSTIEFDREAHATAMKRSAAIGADGKALACPSGELCHANLTEKLLVVALSKLSNLIPEAGIWMNTQRPEWNDANNALVGSGVSMVTLYYLRRYLSFAKELFAESATGSIDIAPEVAEMLAQITSVLESNQSLLGRPITDRERKSVLDGLGLAGEVYRAKLYSNGLSSERSAVTVEQLARFCDVALLHIDHSIIANRREDGLYHSYNLMKVEGEGIQIRRLYEMLEGQVAVLSSGALSVDETLHLLDALRKSSLYREDQQSYILYPDRPLPRFLEKNNIPAGSLQSSKLLSTLVARGDRTVVVRDMNGDLHFNAAFRNADLLKEALDGLKNGPDRSLVEAEGAAILDLYEQVFDHQSFTGRSGTFYKYEGLGCIYWHMVSKLLLAVSEVIEKAAACETCGTTLQSLKNHYAEIREGIGVHKSPSQYGAVPTDPYSHTPGFAGVQQPGMTGQVKEDFISRFTELGVDIEDGEIRFAPKLVVRSEFLSSPKRFDFVDVSGAPQSLSLAPGTLGFTLCQVPVVEHAAGTSRIEVSFADGAVKICDGLTLCLDSSRDIFERTGKVSRLDVYLGLNN
jgi:hypothetical protein